MKCYIELIARDGRVNIGVDEIKESKRTIVKNVYIVGKIFLKTTTSSVVSVILSRPTFTVSPNMSTGVSKCIPLFVYTFKLRLYTTNSCFVLLCVLDSRIY